MLTHEQTENYIKKSRYSIDHLFIAIEHYHKVLKSEKDKVEEILKELESSKQLLSKIFMDRDQWSTNANYYHAQLVEHTKNLTEHQENEKKNAKIQFKEYVDSIGATSESMSCLAGAVLQIAQQTLSLRYDGKPSIPNARNIGTQSIVEVIWEGRNHAMHWDEEVPRIRVKNMLESLFCDMGLGGLEFSKNNCCSILEALKWENPEDVVSDLTKLIE